MSTRANYQDVIVNSENVKKLANFIFETYPQRSYPFCTSFTNYAITTTEEEDLLAEVIAELYDDEYPIYIEIVPLTILNIITQHATKQSQIEAAKKFLRDFIDDAIDCNVRESDATIVDDTEQAA